MSTPEIEALKAALLGRLSSLVHALYGDHAKWTGHEWRIGDVCGEPGFSMAIEGRDSVRLGLWHDHNPAAEHTGGDILDLIAGAQATDFKGAVAWAKAFLGDADLPPAPVRQNAVVRLRHSTDLKGRDGELLKPAKPRSLTQASNALFKHKGAMAQLRKRGLTLATIKHFRLGLYSYEGKQSRVKDALSAPVLDAEGVPLKRSLFSRLPGVTEGGPNPDAKDWAAGKPGTYWVTPRGERKELFVCEGARDGWWLWQALQHSPLSERLCIITSTHGSAVPEAWHSPEFWGEWDKVYLAQDADEAGDALAHRVRGLAGRDVYRVRVPGDYGKDWTDFFRSGQTVDDFAALLESTKIFDVAVQTLPSPTLPNQAGTHAVIPVDVSRTYVNGHLYVPFRVLESRTEKVSGPHSKSGERIVQRYRTLVLRSDGVVCTFGYLPAPRGTPRQDQVLALSDGTLLSCPPVINEANATFSPEAITRFKGARATGHSAMTLMPAELLERIHDHLRASVVLSYPENYALLTFVVVASYAQAIFNSVPLVQFTGPGGNAAGKALLELSCNATLVDGRTPVTTAVRRLDRLGGLAVIDLEGMAKHNSDDEFKEFVQKLETSARKDSSRESWTDPKTLQAEPLELYGIKVLVSPPQVDKPFTIPLLRVYARTKVNDTSALPSSTLQGMRDALHTWVLENVAQIDRRYRQLSAQSQSPQEALRAPLRALAEFLGHSVLSNQLQAALALQETSVTEPVSSVQRVYLAVRNLIRQGYREKVTLKQVMLELHLLASESQDDEPTAKPEWQEPRWVGRTLRAEGLVDLKARDERLWLQGEQTRVLTLESGFVAETLKEFEAPDVVDASIIQQPLKFCLSRPCSECPYASFCSMRPFKEKQ